ncbi:hypothetical protein CDD80_2032 [Ophiocordyceps camponoti-rufipedis]|uniref:Uncharacterized protein n=1 Tax=Ophiocordyceps camponoti-rufipedis TaxID=2004952 RepID=A0A2C5Z7I6_9HYPO|nr:hypothetical protein CDD80_2032 [Ophiocordyceps camponoti-rufipedis]
MSGPDSDLDGQYGYDFSPEEESQLIRLVEEASGEVPISQDDGAFVVQCQSRRSGRWRKGEAEGVVYPDYGSEEGVVGA